MKVRQSLVILVSVLVLSSFCGVFPLLAHSTPQVEITQTLHFDDPEGEGCADSCGYV
jgi:hypothetical protein